MSKKRNRLLIGRDDSGNAQIVLSGTFSISDIRNWAQYFHVIVKGTHKGQDYCWQVVKAKVSEKDLEPCNTPGVGSPPKSKISVF